jgi:predicted nucleotidyltransferase
MDQAEGDLLHARSDMEGPDRSSPSVRVFYPRHDREAVIEALRAGLARLAGRLPIRRAVLFGSYARGNFTVASDIDLLVVYAGAWREDAYALVRQAVCLRGVEAHVYAEGEYAAVAPTIERMIAGGVGLIPA